ncbi:hypothetical protein KIN20_029803 [Parelaphostrongylus tenuis]|uniref:Uncharacterized protein n=1 Tax=Parelaphostrongylus tenuis TaxID=148309 RepID=A0AAD5R340_PARTN|nr:hypothetical protein KIN20_029803 [Parelaphostrongylus tenuis]
MTVFDETPIMAIHDVMLNLDECAGSPVTKNNTVVDDLSGQRWSLPTLADTPRLGPRKAIS